jgi:hypothetical protein
MVEIELLLTSSETTVAFRLNSPDPIEVIPFDASDKVVTLTNCCAKLVGTLVNRFPLRSIVSMGAVMVETVAMIAFIPVSSTF